MRIFINKILLSLQNKFLQKKLLLKISNLLGYYYFLAILANFFSEILAKNI